jgi:hypothetical protein
MVYSSSIHKHMYCYHIAVLIHCMDLYVQCSEWSIIMGNATSYYHRYETHYCRDAAGNEIRVLVDVKHYREI